MLNPGEKQESAESQEKEEVKQGDNKPSDDKSKSE